MKAGWAASFKPNFTDKKSQNFPTPGPPTTHRPPALKRTSEVEHLETALRGRIGRTTSDCRTPRDNQLPHYETPIGRGPYLTIGTRADDLSQHPPQQTQHLEQHSRNDSPKVVQFERPTVSPHPRPYCHGFDSTIDGCNHAHIQQRLVSPVRDVRRRHVGQGHVGQVIVEEERPGFFERFCDGVSDLLVGRSRSVTENRRRSGSCYRSRRAQSLVPSIQQRAFRGDRADYEGMNWPQPPTIWSQPQPKFAYRQRLPSPPRFPSPQRAPAPHYMTQPIPPPWARSLPCSVPFPRPPVPKPHEPVNGVPPQGMQQPVVIPRSASLSPTIPVKQLNPALVTPAPQTGPLRSAVYEIPTFRQHQSPPELSFERSPNAWQTLTLQRSSNVCLKKAFCVGIGYLSHICELRAAVNDAQDVATTLKRFPFDFNVKVLTDAPVGGSLNISSKPTKENILNGLKWLVEDCCSGDVLLFYFSGCSARVPNMESDGRGEDCLVPCDFTSASFDAPDVSQPRLIYSDEVHQILNQGLKPGVQFLSLMDCSSASTIIPIPTALELSNNTPAIVRRDEKPSVSFPNSGSRLWIQYSTSQVKAKRLYEPHISSFFRVSKFNGYHQDPLRIGAVVRSASMPSPSVFCFEASTASQQAHEALIDGHFRGLLTLCVLRALSSVDLKSASVYAVFESACAHLEKLKLTGPNELVSLDQTFLLGFSPATHPMATRFLDCTPLPASETIGQRIHHDPSWAVTATVPLSPCQADSAAYSSEGDEPDVVVAVVESVSDIRSELFEESNRYFLGFGMTPVADQSTRPAPTDQLTSRKWATRDISDPRFEECLFNDRVIVRRGVVSLAVYLRLTLWRSNEEFDDPIGVLLVNMDDKKLRSPQLWLMRDFQGRPVATITFHLDRSFPTSPMKSSYCSEPLHYTAGQQSPDYLPRYYAGTGNLHLADGCSS